MTSKVIKTKKLLLNGIFGVLKEKGHSLEDYKTWIRLTHYNENILGDYEKQWNSPAIILDIKPRHLEPFATGVLCVGIGFWSTNLTALTQYWPHEWIVCAKLGTHTENYWSDSPVIYEKPFDHINVDILKEALKQFIGPVEQFSPPYILKESLLLPKSFSQITYKKESTKSVVPPKPMPTIRECHSIEVLHFEPPDVKLKVISDGQFSCRTLIHDLGLKVNSCAHITELHLNKMGVISIEHCLKTYELHSKQISEAIDKYSKLCSKELKKFEDMKKKFGRRI